MTAALRVLLLLASLGCVAAAQTATPLAEIEIGFRNRPVADAWNPLRVTVRDVGSGGLTLVADQGSLRDGEVPWSFTLPLAGGAGVRVVEADVFLPIWRTLRWSLEAGGSVIASGAWPRDVADRRPVDLVVSTRPGWIAERLGGRVVDVAADALPIRAAAYDGVRSLWIDGSARAPAAAALTAAAAAGVVVVALEAARDDPAWGGLLPSGAWTPIGAGAAWTGAAPSAAQLEGARVDLRAWVAAFAAASDVAVPATAPVAQVMLAASLYVLLVLVSWRAGGAPGLATWLVLVAGASGWAWSTWRHDTATFRVVRSLQVGADALAWRVRAHDVLTLPAAEVAVAAVTRPAAATTGAARLGALPATTLALARWRGATLLEAPQATMALLGWDGAGRPAALGAGALTEVRVVGGPAWDVVRSGEPLGEPRDPRPLMGAEAAFEALLPAGAAWGRVGADWHVALPTEVRW